MTEYREPIPIHTTSDLRSLVGAPVIDQTGEPVGRVDEVEIEASTDGENICRALVRSLQAIDSIVTHTTSVVFALGPGMFAQRSICMNALYTGTSAPPREHTTNRKAKRQRCKAARRARLAGGRHAP